MTVLDVSAPADQTSREMASVASQISSKGPLLFCGSKQGKMISDEWTDRANGDDAGILEELGSSIW